MDVLFSERVFCGILFPAKRAIRCASKPFLPLGFAPIFARGFFCRAREEAFRLLNIDRIFGACVLGCAAHFDTLC